ncbi:TIM-barrel domain-containing protein [Bacteroides sp.]|uniref:TIM-barrel domain-containing protein n=1 Tax=Bacteroides sp. TaxID=29523 RepID=UPI0026073DB1|nr:TIM-barrel domain-containing protein [Bacteroides sp.]MDD3036487.1 glycoside hydrolase family 31 protein [Bacteroides sp.]
MKSNIFSYQRFLLIGVLLCLHLCCFAQVLQESSQREILRVKKINPTAVDIQFSDHQQMTIDFYGENIFRIFQDNSGGIIRDPEATPEAQILVNCPRRKVSQLVVSEEGDLVTLITDKVKVELSKKTGLMKVINLNTNVCVIEEVAPVVFDPKKVTVTLKEHPDEYFYGGGVQNGRFSHKGKVIAIENQNSWTDGGVASPTPFYWSTKGYGVMWYTFKKGEYDFGATEKDRVKLFHESSYLDIFYMVDDGAVALLNDFYQLTGAPVLLPKFGFYEGHLNAYNRDYWKEDSNGILFEDGKRYKESQKDNGGIKESLNGEKNNYQFSARAVIDRYKNHDMPLGWLLPNDGYGAGYGQTETLDGNIENLKSLGQYARKNGVEIGLWTQSDLHPKTGVSALLQRDIVKEVRDAGVRVLKTDVAWVGAGYSFGLNGVADVGHTMPYYGSDARPFIISLDGWAGTQRYAGIWSGDQTGGVWEYIRFHIPTYIGSGLSGQPNICSDMDGIFGGKNEVVNIRDFQWKTFTPMQLNMDGWGANEKYPHALGEPAASINRMYLKLKSELIPYTYSFAKEAVTGLPLIRAMLLEYPNAYTYGPATQYQYMYGTDFLVAPVYQNTGSDKDGNDIRNGIYVPEGVWIDYFSGEKYEGNRILNNFEVPIWKLPVFVKNGAIISMTNPNNNVNEIDRSLRIYEFYPYQHSSVVEYDDDGVTEAYREGKSATTLIESEVNSKNRVTITIHPTKGNFDGFVTEKATELRINVTEKPNKLQAKIGNKVVKLIEVNTIDEFLKGENIYWYEDSPNLNKFATKGSEFEKVKITKNPQLRVKLASTDISSSPVMLKMQGFHFEPSNSYRVTTGTLIVPQNAQVTEQNREAYTLKPTWDKVPNADFYEIEFNGMLYTTIKDTELLFEDLTAETPYLFKVRAVNKDGVSDWSEIRVTTKENPLEFAIYDIEGESSAAAQGGSGVNRLFDFAESGDVWHTKYSVNSIPLDLIIDLKTVNQLDKFHYLPRTDAGNGTLLKGTVSYSMDKENWTEAGTFEWQRNADVKVFSFTKHPSARYIKLTVTAGVGNYGSGREIYVFKVPGTSSYLQGDINNDGKIDRNDLTSYMNYTGLRRGDSDYEGYISKGDINMNNLIDAYDISVVATQLEGGVDKKAVQNVAGSLSISTPKQVYQKDEIVEIHVKGNQLQSVNALSFALPYDQNDYEFVSIEPLNMKAMENLTYDRLHTNGVKSLYPTFANIGEQELLAGSQELFILKLKAKRKVKFDLQMRDGILVDKQLKMYQF